LFKLSSTLTANELGATSRGRGTFWGLQKVTFDGINIFSPFKYFGRYHFRGIKGCAGLKLCLTIPGNELGATSRVCDSF
jgi:hypothetical protein